MVACDIYVSESLIARSVSDLYGRRACVCARTVEACAESNGAIAAVMRALLTPGLLSTMRCVREGGSIVLTVCCVRCRGCLCVTALRRMWPFTPRALVFCLCHMYICVFVFLFCVRAFVLDVSLFSPAQRGQAPGDAAGREADRDADAHMECLDAVAPDRLVAGARAGD